MTNIHPVGVNDRHKTLFEGLWPLPYGVSYNAYIIDDEKVALVDTVEVDFFSQFIDNVRRVIGDRPIDYIIVNHMEPDHSGSLALIKLDVTEHVLFSGDAFGCFGALNGAYVDSEMNCDVYWNEMQRYYSNIVGKYGVPVQQALKKLAGVQIDYICPTHGPIWHEHIARVIGEYDRMSRYATEPGLVICYGSMYGNTERAAEKIASAASRAGVKNIVLHDVSRENHSFILSDIFKYSGLILGAPTYNNGIYPGMEMLLSELAGRCIKNHYLGIFGSFTWAGQVVKKITEWNETQMKFELVGTPVEIKQSLSAETEAACEALGKAMAERLK